MEGRLKSLAAHIAAEVKRLSGAIAAARHAMFNIGMDLEEAFDELNDSVKYAEFVKTVKLDERQAREYRAFYRTFKGRIKRNPQYFERMPWDASTSLALLRLPEKHRNEVLDKVEKGDPVPELNARSVKAVSKFLRDKKFETVGEALKAFNSQGKTLVAKETEVARLKRENEELKKENARLTAEVARLTRELDKRNGVK
jgi:hypothetical protein